jgi:hypothetical protein
MPMMQMHAFTENTIDAGFHHYAQQPALDRQAGVDRLQPPQRRRRGAWGGRPCAANAEETANHVRSGLAPGRIPRYPWVQCSFMFLNRSGRM